MEIEPEEQKQVPLCDGVLLHILTNADEAGCGKTFALLGVTPLAQYRTHAPQSIYIPISLKKD